ncbi:amidohydrolase [Carboxylicivirga caseinilyticus]|uniref:amidohydrolase n=1 Tax=Carboxylicivirga caseinilyticus TaxID=3417572 RepID=UPI003D3476A1|nr:amidohydrolase [Marinilabiliaceae bacterium A049]
MNVLNVALVQHDIVWENTKENLTNLDGLLDGLDTNVDLVVLPEMFHAGFTMNPQNVAQSFSDEVLSWMKNKAQDLKVCLIGSVVFTNEEKFFNRLFVFYPDGKFKYYDKRHLFGIGGENELYEAGQERLIFEYKGWKICPLICYDLRFPVWSRNTVDYDLLIYVANWPQPRREVWSVLLRSRSIENQCFVVGVNRVGKDVNCSYSGDSVVVNPKGSPVLQFEDGQQAVRSIEISKDELIQFRDRFPVWKDRDEFTIL